MAIGERTEASTPPLLTRSAQKNQLLSKSGFAEQKQCIIKTSADSANTRARCRDALSGCDLIKMVATRSSVRKRKTREFYSSQYSDVNKKRLNKSVKTSTTANTPSVERRLQMSSDTQGRPIAMVTKNVRETRPKRKGRNGTPGYNHNSKENSPDVFDFAPETELVLGKNTSNKSSGNNSVEKELFTPTGTTRKSQLKAARLTASKKSETKQEFLKRTDQKSCSPIDRKYPKRNAFKKASVDDFEEAVCPQRERKTLHPTNKTGKTIAKSVFDCNNIVGDAKDDVDSDGNSLYSTMSNPESDEATEDFSVDSDTQSVLSTPAKDFIDVSQGIMSYSKSASLLSRPATRSMLPCNIHQSTENPSLTDYFVARTLNPPANASKKALMDLPKRDEIYGLLEDVDLVDSTDYLDSLEEHYEKSFAFWRIELLSGFNLLFTGFGSKKALLERFAAVALGDQKTLVVDGYLSTINIRDIARFIWEKILRNNRTHSSAIETCKAISDHKPIEHGADQAQDSRGRSAPFRLVVIVHSLDGEGLRSSEAQTCLSIWASVPWIHLVASIDHMNAPMLWNDVHLQRFRWARHNTPTLRMYADEVVIDVLSSSRTKMKSVSEVKYILDSLTPNQIALLQQVVEYQQTVSANGIKYEDLLSLFKKKVIATGGDSTLRTALMELSTNHLIKYNKTRENSDIVYVPISLNIMEEAMKQTREESY